MVNLHSSEIFRLLLLLRIHGKHKLIRKLVVFLCVVVEERPTDHFCSWSVLRVSIVYQSPCLCFGSHNVHVLVGVDTCSGQHCCGCFRRLIRFTQRLRICISLSLRVYSCICQYFCDRPVLRDRWSKSRTGVCCDILLLHLDFAVCRSIL